MFRSLSVAVILATVSFSHAQSLQQSPDVTAVKFSWSKERIGWERDPFGGPIENFDEMRARARNEKRIDDSKRGGGVEVDRIRQEARTDASIVQKARQQRPARYQFLYKLSFLNRGTKAIKEMDFDYVFFDAATGEELGRRQFTGDQKIPPGKSRELSFMLSTPPTHRISVHALDKKERDGVSERVDIIRVLYEDGSVWQQK